MDNIRVIIKRWNNPEISVTVDSLSSMFTLKVILENSVAVEWFSLGDKKLESATSAYIRTTLNG